MYSFFAIPFFLMALMAIHGSSEVIGRRDTTAVASADPAFSTEGLLPAPIFFEPMDGNNATEMAGWYKCETSRGPRQNDIQDAINKLGRKHQDCTVLNGRNSHCNPMERSGTAALGICGRLWYSTPCRNAALMAQWINDRCGWYGLAGGTYYLDGHLKVIVYHN